MTKNMIDPSWPDLSKSGIPQPMTEEERKGKAAFDSVFDELETQTAYEERIAREKEEQQRRDRIKKADYLARMDAKSEAESAKIIDSMDEYPQF